ncbi:MAG TPA: UvrD-helicase domain-containing protein [Solirubrobacteraceae bacterium]|jgi:ATP-dependent exoDNAse (exonuclease V) beta subunit
MRVLTSEQEEAVARRRGPLLLAAAAGSGKTAVLVERFVRAIREDGVAPGRILAITFTERAAGELRARVRERLLALGEREAARDTEGAPIGTFHGFCTRLLRIHALHAGLDPEFAILDEPGAGRLALLAFRRALAELLTEERPAREREQAVDLVAAYGADRLRAMLLRVYAEQRSRGVAVPRLPLHALAREAAAGAAEQRDDAALQACALLDETLKSFGEHYADLKRERGALDFDDLELGAHELLVSHEDIRAAWSERLELLMVDEFQDTNSRQLALLALLDRGNLFTVGDELQSIYGFRYADVGIFRERRAALRGQGAALVLARNFRARPALLEAVNTVFAARFGDTYMPLIAAREAADGGGEVVARRGPAARARVRAAGSAQVAAPAAPTEATPTDSTRDTPPLELLLTDRRGWETCPDVHAITGGLPPAPLWRRAEARLLAQRIAQLVAGGEVAAGDVVVLLRAAGDLPVYERALQDRGLRTLAAVGSFWGHQQVADLLAWLRALANPLDEVALYGALASPLVGLSSDAIASLALNARKQGGGVWATIERADADLYTGLPIDDRERLRRFAGTFAQERRLAPAHGVAELLLRAIAASGYERHVRSLSWAERRLANIHKLLRLARRFEAAEGRGLRAFLDHVAHRGAFAQGAEPQAPTGGAEPDAVRLMTIHAAKGLEFGVVCIADLGRATNGTPPDLLLDGDRVGLRLASLDGCEPRACLRYVQLSQERRDAEQAEEERIVYVAMTRARERLLLSGAVDFTRWPAARAGGPPIAWLAPALCAEVPEYARTLERPVLDVAVGGTKMRSQLSSPVTVGRVLEVDCGATIRPVPHAPRAAMLVT